MNENPYEPPKEIPPPTPFEPGVASYFALSAAVILLTLFLGYLIDQMVN